MARVCLLAALVVGFWIAAQGVMGQTVYGPYGSQPYAWRNSPNNFANSSDNWRNSPNNFDNSRYNYAPPRGHSRMYSVDGAYEGYAVRRPRSDGGGVNLFSGEGDRRGYMDGDLE